MRNTRRIGRRDPFPYLLVAPVQAMLASLILLPVLYTLWLSFHNYTYGKPVSFAGLRNYAVIVRDRAFWRAFWNNVIFVNIVVYLELAVGLGMAVFFSGRVPFKRLAISVVMAPYAVSPVLGVLMWRFLLEPDIGLINGMLQSLHLPHIEWTVNPVHAFAVMILLSIWLQAPFTFLILYNSILGIPRELFEAAAVDGATAWQIFARVTVPVIMPGILVSLMFRYVFAFRTFDVVWILTAGGPYRSTELLSVYLYRRGFTYYEFGIASAVSWVIVVVTILMAAHYFRLMYRSMFADGK